MAEYVVVGGSRKNPAVERINNSKRQSAQQSQAVLAEMKTIATGKNAAGVSMPDGEGDSNDKAAAQRTQMANVHNIPLRFNKGRE